MGAETGRASLPLGSAAETEAFGSRLAEALEPGDFLALSGPLGAGKSHLVRAIVRSLLHDPRAEVPSPSYTLVNIYDGPAGEIWHADLYRIGGADEAAELGLLEALNHAVLLVEWPSRLGPLLPERRLDITLAVGEDAAEGAEDRAPRRAEIMARGPGWDRALASVATTRSEAR